MAPISDHYSFVLSVEAAIVLAALRLHSCTFFSHCLFFVPIQSNLKHPVVLEEALSDVAFVEEGLVEQELCVEV